MTTAGEAPPQSHRRPTCAACARPTRVCLCAALPPTPHPLHGRVIVLQHPHECRRPKQTVPLLGQCVSPVSVLVGRVFQQSEVAARWPRALADAVADAAAGTAPLFILWPCPQESVELGHAVQDSGLGPGGPYTLLALDGTWRQAKEMWGHVKGWADSAPGVWVVRADGAPTPAPGALFVEPGSGCVTTAEAVAAGLVGLEPPGAPGPRAVVAAVAAVTATAATFDPAIKARVDQAASRVGGV